MASLLDIIPPAAEVAVGDKTIRVHGISAGGIASLLARFPKLREMFAGRDVDTGDLMSLGGEIVSAIIAAGCGLPGNTDAERVAALLPLGQQADILSAIIEQTMPGGADPLAAKLARLGRMLGFNAPASEPVSAPEPTLPAPAAYRNGHDPAGSTATSYPQ